MEPWILQLCRQTCGRVLMACGGVFAAILLLLAYQHRYMDNYLFGPYAMGAAELQAIHGVDLAPHYFAQVSGTEPIATGFEKITIHKKHGREVDRQVVTYYALLVGERYLIVEGKADMPTLVQGELAPLPTELAQKLFETEDGPEYRERFYPFYLNTDSFTFLGNVELFAFGLVLVYLLWKVFWARSWLRELTRHPVAVRIAKWGALDEQCAAIATEFTRDRVTTISDWTVTKNYLVRCSFFSLDVLRFQDLLWAYKKVTKHSVNFIPTGKSFHVVLCFYGSNVEIDAAATDTDMLLGYAQQLAPWAAFGYTEQVKDMFEKKTKEFVALVEKRRQQMTK